jgi:hypothetical protein
MALEAVWHPFQQQEEEEEGEGQQPQHPHQAGFVEG